MTELMEYDFELVHISGKKNGWANTLSKRPDYDQGDNNNKNLVMLPPRFFSKIYARVMGSKEANPNNEKEWRHYRAGVVFCYLLAYA